MITAALSDRGWSWRTGSNTRRPTHLSTTGVLVWTLVKEGQSRGAEFIAHGLSRRHIIHIGMSEDEECQYIRASIAAVERATGTRPVGWSGPDFQETPNTPNLLAAEGIRYVCDWGNDEQPYRMTPQTGELYSLVCRI